jgi:nitrogen fixation protein FixH
MTFGFFDARRPPAALTGRHVLIAMLGFFGVVFAVNGYFLYSALATHTGVVTVEPYRKGLAYNRRIEAAERQTGLGWTDSLAIEHGGAVTLDLRTPTSGAARGLQITGSIGRPSTEQYDRPLRFVEREGRYVADVGPLPPGSWIVAIVARAEREPDPVYRARRRLWLKP